MNFAASRIWDDNQVLAAKNGELDREKRGFREELRREQTAREGLKKELEVVRQEKEGLRDEVGRSREVVNLVRAFAVEFGQLDEARVTGVSNEASADVGQFGREQTATSVSEAVTPENNDPGKMTRSDMADPVAEVAVWLGYSG